MRSSLDLRRDPLGQVEARRLTDEVRADAAGLCPASPTSGPHRWLAYRTPGPAGSAAWTCLACRAEAYAAPDPRTGCAPAQGAAITTPEDR